MLLSYNECLERATAARAKALAATTPDAEREYREIAKLWDDLCDSMRKNGLTQMSAPPSSS